MSDSKERIDWRGMFKRVVNRMREAGESQEMGARWMAEEASNAVFDLTEENKRLQRLIEVAVDHIALMYSGIAGGNAEAGQNFADKDPVVKAMREAIAKAEGRASPLPADNGRAEDERRTNISKFIDENELYTGELWWMERDAFEGWK